MSREPAPTPPNDASEARPTDRIDRVRWQAVANRDRSMRGSFVYAVETTGVYCRPGCPSRLPKRDHVRFYETPREAERAGFRPCRRCAPQRVSPPDPARDAVVRACRMIERAARPPTLRALADAVGLSPHHFQRLFKSVVGVTPREYAAGRRVARLQARLSDGAAVTEALYDAGFGSSSRLYEGAAAALGMKPSRYREGGAGEAVRFTVRPCTLGWVLVAATERGVCAISLGDAPGPLEDDLRSRFPDAELSGDDPQFTEWVSRVVERVETPARSPDLPLDVRGTAFQRQVWRALTQIPTGATATYGELAVRLGRPSAARAVGRACAENPLAVVIPCHRVVGADGALTGYRWGVERKRALLEREGERSPPGAEALAQEEPPEEVTSRR